MNNPWIDLPKTAPFILDCDAGYVEKYNESAKPKHFIQTKLPPEPFAGDPAAPVVLLALNPGYTDIYDAEYMINNADFVQAMENTRTHVPQAYPFYHLAPRYPRNPGFLYWTCAMKDILYRVSHEICANKIFLAEFFPYKTKQGRNFRVLDSQKYTFSLVAAAMKRNAMIILLRSQKLWEEHIEGLCTYKKLICCQSPRRAILSPGNIGEKNFDELISILKAN